MDGAELELRNMDVKSRITGAVDRMKWASLVREANDKLKGL
jgi:hypothetical protein